MPTPPVKPTFPSTTRILRCVRSSTPSSVFQRAGSYQASWWYRLSSTPASFMRFTYDASMRRLPNQSITTWVGTRARGERLGEPRADPALPVHEGLEADRAVRLADRVQHRREDLVAVAQRLD